MKNGFILISLAVVVICLTWSFVGVAGHLNGASTESSTILFGGGILMIGVTGIISWLGRGDDKKGVVALPFMLLFAALVGGFLGL